MFHLPYAPLIPLIEEITQAVQPETILCYGIHPSCPPGQERPHTREKIQYHLMIIHKTANAKYHRLLDTITGVYLPRMQISITVFQPEEIRVALQAGSPFIIYYSGLPAGNIAIWHTADPYTATYALRFHTIQASLGQALAFLLLLGAVSLRCGGKGYRGCVLRNSLRALT